MFGYIRGTLTKTSPLYVIIETAGVGYKLFVPASLHANLPPLNQNLILYTSFIVRENSQTLYGFISEIEKDFFELLVTVSGVGPKIALSIIGHFAPEKIYESIVENDITTLCKIPGIGRKSAERLVMELKDKIDLSFSNKPQNLSVNLNYPQLQLIKDAMSTLVNLGYNQSIAEKAIKKTLSENPEANDLAKIIKVSLKNV